MIYRNQTDTMTQITMLSHLRITTTQEAVAFLRAIQPLQEQVAYVLQRKALADQQAMNRQTAPAPALQPEPTPAPEPDKPFEAEDLSSDEDYSEAEMKAQVEKLKKAKEAKEAKEVKTKGTKKEG